MARTPGIFSAADVSSLTTRPLPTVASTGTAYSSPGKRKSEVYCATPVTFTGPSIRGVPRPTGEPVAVSFAAGMFAPSVGSACGRDFEGVGEAAPGQFDLERVLALRLGVAQGRFRRLAEDRLVGGLADKHGFGVGRAPG